MPLDLLAPHAEADRHRIALVHHERALGYGTLALEVRRLASGLRGHLDRGDLLALWLSNGPELLCMILACFEAGIVPMPLHEGMRWPEVRAILAHGNVMSLVATSASIAAHADEIDVPDRVFVIDDAPPPARARPYADLRGDERGFVAASVGPDETCLILHTSGSDGRPKSVMLARRSIEHILAYRLAHTALGPDSIAVVASCLTQSVGLYQSLALLAAGGTIVLLDSYDADVMVDAIHDYRPTHLIMVVDAFDRLLHHPKLTTASLASVTFASVGADRVTDRVQRRFIDLTGRPLCVTYGMTESSWALVNPGDRVDKCLALGKPCPGIEVRLLSTDGDEVGTGEIGEIHIKSPRTMLGYLGDDALTRTVLVDGWLASGDLAWRDDEGWFWFAGRRKNLIVLATGDNVSPLEVEEALLSHPGVTACVVVGVATAEGSQTPWAVVVRRDDAVTETTVTAFLRERLSDYKIPQRVVFVRELPVGLTGKVEREQVLRLVGA